MPNRRPAPRAARTPGRAQAVFETLRDGIVAGDFPAGERLPPERELVVRYGASRAAVREALKRLAQAGLVTTVHGGGTRVENPRRAAGLDLLESIALAGAGEQRRAVMRGVVEMRSVLSVDAARLAALRHTERQLAAIRSRIAELGGTQDDAALHQRIVAAWDAVVDASGNVAYRLAFNSLREGYDLFGKPLHKALRDAFHAPDYRVLAEAIAAHDTTRAERAARRILEKDAALVVERFGF